MIELFNKRPYIDDLEYECGRGFLEGFLIKELIEAFDDIVISLDDLLLPVSDANSLHSYLWCRMFKKVSENLSILNIPEESKKRFVEIDKRLILDHKSFIHYMNEHYQDVHDLNEKKFLLLKNIAFETMFDNFGKNVSDGLANFVIEKRSLHILSRYRFYKTYFSDKKDKIELLFCDLDKYRVIDRFVYIDFLLKFNEKKLVERFAIKILCDALPFFTSSEVNGDNKSIIQIQSIFQEYYKLSKIYQSKISNEYEEAKNSIEKSLDYFIRNYGEKYTYGSVNFKDKLIDPYLKDENPIKFLRYTHGIIKGERICILNKILKPSNKNPLSELGNDISRGRSKKYPYSKQDEMNVNLAYFAQGLVAIFNEKTLSKEFADYITNVCKYIEKNYFNDKIEIEDEASSIVDGISYYIKLSKNKQEDCYLGHFILRSISSNSIFLIEKLLRNIAYKEVKNESYFDFETETLASLLSGKYELDDISDGLKYYMVYYLLQDPNTFSPLDRRPGLKVRNKIVHNYNETCKENDFGCGMTCFFLLFSLINCLFIKFLK